MFDEKSRARLARVQQFEQPRTVLIEHKPVVHDAMTPCFAHGELDACRCYATCTCGAAVVLPGQVACFTFNHSEPGPMVRRV